MRLVTLRLILPLCLITDLFTSNALSAQTLLPPGQPVLLSAQQKRHLVTVTSPQMTVTLGGLTPGQTYLLSVPPTYGLNGCQPLLNGGPLPPGGITGSISFLATGSQFTITLDYPCSWSIAPGASAPEQAVSINCTSCPPKQEVQATPEAVLEVEGTDPFTAVSDVLIGGNCFDVTGISFTGGSGQLGVFSSGQTNVGFPTGVIISTGSVFTAVGPNDQDGAGGGGGGGTSDVNLSQLSTGPLFDVAKLEFDFTPTQPNVVFEYVFASEEYCEYVGSTFNDVFGFFISGPGIAGTQNLALVGPGTPVAINNVNHLTNAGLYINNQPNTSTNLCGQSASVSPIVSELQYDGLTRKFIASATLQSCQTYHIKLAIGDVGDDAWDSAVFLKAGSFDAGGNASVQWLVDGVPDDEAYEACSPVGLQFERVGGSTTSPMTVQFTVSGTATSGLDFTPIPSTIIIPAGQDQFTLPVNILSDLIAEGVETITVTLNNLCSCAMPQVTLNINDLLPMMTQPDTVVVCAGGEVFLEATVQGGLEPYTYLWSFGTDEQSVTLNAQFSNTYRVTITDACGKTVVQTHRVNVTPAPRAQLLPPAPQICPGGSGVLNITFIGSGPFEIIYSINNVEQPPISGIASSPYQLMVNQPGTYQVVNVTDAFGCQGNGQGLQVVQQSSLNVTGSGSTIDCSTQSGGSINTTAAGGQGTYTYAWTGPQTIGNVADPTGLSPGTYLLTVTDGAGCTVTNSFTISTNNPIVPVIAGIQSPTCFNPQGGSVNLEASGGTGPLSYLWSNMTTGQDLVNVGAGTYVVTISDAAGCTRTVTANVVGNNTPPAAVALAPNGITCDIDTVTLNGQGSSVGPDFSYQWVAVTPGANIVSGATGLLPVVNQGGTYRIIVSNSANGCTSTADAQVLANTAPPVAEAGPTQTLTCAILTTTLNGTGSSAGNSNFEYAWTASPGANIAGGSNTLQPIVSSIGTYTLTVRNIQNGCTATDQVVVDQNLVTPSASVAPAALISCAQSTVTLNASGSTPSGLVYFWQTFNGNVLSGNDSPNPVVGEPGDYTVIVTDPNNGCTDDATVIVDQDFSTPTAIATVNDELNCATQQVVINGSTSSSGAGFSFSWSSSPGGNILSGGNTLTPTVNQPGLYTLVITNLASNCTASASVQVSQNLTPPVAVAGQPGTINCYNPVMVLGDPGAFVVPGTSYTWTASNGGSIQSGNGTPSITVVQAGTYTVSVFNQVNGCSNSASVSVAIDNTAPTAVVAPANSLTCTTQFVQLNGAGSSGGPAYSYQWNTTGGVISAGPNSLTPAVTAAGTYTLVVTNIGNGCTSSASTTVMANLSVPQVVIAPASAITCNIQQVQLNATSGTSTGPNFQYQWGTVGGTILNGANSLTPNVSEPGVYTLIVTNTTNNCTAVQNVTVPGDITPPPVSTGAAQVLNCTLTSIVLTGTAPIGPTYTYAWTASAGGNIVDGANTLTATVDEPGNYTLSVTNTTSGCTSASTVQVLQDAGQPVAQIAAPATLTCIVQQMVLNAAASSTGSNFEYGWDGPGTIDNANTLNPTIYDPGVYTLFILNNNNGCTTSATVTVPENVVLPVASAGPNATLNCYNPALALGDTGMSTGPDFTYVWSGIGIQSGATTATPLVNLPGNYNVTVTNVTNGCTATDVVSLNADFNTPNVDAGPGFELTCIDNSYQTQPTASIGANFTYHWATNFGSFVNSTEQLAPLVNGVGYYYLTVTNTTNGCTATDQMQITQTNDFPTANAGVNALLTCSVTQLTLDGTNSSQNGPYTYLWVPISGGNIVSGANTLTPLINAPGTYQLIVQDTSNSCISNSSVIVNANVQPPAIDAGPTVTLTCYSAAVGLQGSVTSNGNFTYAWSGGNILSGGNTLSPTVTAIGAYALTVTNTVNGCTATDVTNVQADLNAPVVVLASPDTLTCIVQQVSISAQGTSVGNNLIYSWSSPNGNIIDQSNLFNVTVNKAGQYQLLVTNLSNSCATVAVVQVAEDKVNPIAKAGADSLLSCNRVITGLDGTGSSQGGGVNYFYAWTTPNGEIIAGANTLSPTVSAAGSYLLTVLNTDNGCSSSDLAVVIQDVNLPTISLAVPAVLTCFSPEVILDGSGSSQGPNFDYAWTTPNGNFVSAQDGPQAVVDAEGSYTLTVLNTANGCANASTTLVVENLVAPSLLILPPNNLTCSVPEVQVTCLASNGSQFVYGWSTLNGNIVSGFNSLNPIVNKAGTYSILAVNNSNGCAALKSTEVIEITARPTDFLFTLDVPGCRGNNGVVRFDSVVGGIGPYLYSLDGGDNFATSDVFGSIKPGTYELVVQDLNGCEFALPLDVPEAPVPAIDVIPELDLEFGDSVRLEAILPPNYPLDLIDTITWTPLDYLTFESNSIEDLLSPWCKPFHTVLYKVRVVSKDGGCEATDRVYVRLNNEPHVYIPNVFQPENPANGNNGLAMIFADDQRKQIKQVNVFRIFDRWGNQHYLGQNFQPNDPAYGWNGRIDNIGKMCNPAVFVYYAEVELIDGRTLFFEGDITLVR